MLAKMTTDAARPNRLDGGRSSGPGGRAGGQSRQASASRRCRRGALGTRGSAPPESLRRASCEPQRGAWQRWSWRGRVCTRSPCWSDRAPRDPRRAARSATARGSRASGALLRATMNRRPSVSNVSTRLQRPSTRPRHVSRASRGFRRRSDERAQSMRRTASRRASRALRACAGGSACSQRPSGARMASAPGNGSPPVSARLRRSPADTCATIRAHACDSARVGRMDVRAARRSRRRGKRCPSRGR